MGLGVAFLILIDPPLLAPLPKICGQRVFQALSVLGAEELQKLLSVEPSSYIFSKNARNLTTTPKGKSIGRNFGFLSLGFRAIFWVVSATRKDCLPERLPARIQEGPLV